VKLYGGVLEINMESNTMQNRVRCVQDPDGTDIGMLTGVTVHDDKLYLGSLRNDYIGVYDDTE